MRVPSLFHTSTLEFFKSSLLGEAIIVCTQLLPSCQRPDVTFRSPIGHIVLFVVNTTQQTHMQAQVCTHSFFPPIASYTVVDCPLTGRPPDDDLVMPPRLLKLPPRPRLEPWPLDESERWRKSLPLRLGLELFSVRSPLLRPGRQGCCCCCCCCLPSELVASVLVFSFRAERKNRKERHRDRKDR